MKRRDTTFVSTLVAIVAAIAVFKKHWFLLLPNGYILYALSGGPIPPYMQPRALHDHEPWFLPGSVMIASCSKCGTNWNMNIFHLIRTKGVDDFEDIYSVVPWPDFINYPGQTWHDQLETLNSLAGSTKYPFRIFKTHFAPPELPVLDNRKYVVVVRNATDVMASVKSFFENLDERFIEAWGGFPPSFKSDEDFYHWWNVDKGDGSSASEEMYFKFIKGWWPHRHRSNVMMIHYNDLKRDLRGVVRAYAEFVGQNLTHAQYESVLDHSSFEYMKQNSEKYEATSIVQRGKELGYYPKDGRLLKPKAMVRKGAVGEGRNELSEDGLEQFLQVYEKEMNDPDMKYWCDFGGTLP